jgi:putative ABC transport system permease protein
MIGTLQILRIAARALMRHKGRSFLTVLGIIIGIAAVIAMVGIGEGAKVQVAKSFENMGTNLLILMPGAANIGGMHGGFGSKLTVTIEDLDAIRQLPKIQRASPRPELNRVQLLGPDSNWATDVGGVIPDFFDIRVWHIEKGRQISMSDVDNGAKVIVLGQTVSEKLFGAGVDPIGQQVRVDNIPFNVIGLLEHHGPSPWGNDLDDNAYVPYTTYVAKLHGGMRQFVPGVSYLRATSSDDALEAEREVRTLLRDRHHLVEGVEDDFDIRNMAEAAEAQVKGAQTITQLMAAVAAVSLLIAGIGIMNIMLVSVSERTREIGLRLAIGAKPRDILTQFLVEALTLALVGGVLGVLVGLLSSSQLTHWFGWPLRLRPDGIVAAVATSAAVGIVFGILPAWRAARLDPVTALRYE